MCKIVIWSPYYFFKQEKHDYFQDLVYKLIIPVCNDSNDDPSWNNGVTAFGAYPSI